LSRAPSLRRSRPAWTEPTRWRDGLRETRRAVGTLRSEPIAAQAGIEALVEEYRAGDGAAELTIDGDPGRLAGPVDEAVLRVVRETLTNVRKHAPGASVSVALHAGDLADRDVVLVVNDHPNGTARAPGPLAATGGGWCPGHVRTCPGSRRHPSRLAPAGMAGGSNCAFRFSPGLRAQPKRRCRFAGLRPGGPVVSDSIRVLVADDQVLVREGLMTLLQVAAGIEPVAAAADGEEAVVLAARHRPHVVLMDLRMPQLDGVEATRRIRAAQPETEIVVLTTHADDQSILGALQAGARGYLTKDAGISEISRAIQAVHYAYTHGLAV
jgi:CheY-like chemotaxis protein